MLLVVNKITGCLFIIWIINQHLLCVNSRQFDRTSLYRLRAACEHCRTGWVRDEPCWIWAFCRSQLWNYAPYLTLKEMQNWLFSTYLYVIENNQMIQVLKVSRRNRLHDCKQCKVINHVPLIGSSLLTTSIRSKYIITPPLVPHGTFFTSSVWSVVCKSKLLLLI